MKKKKLEFSSIVSRNGSADPDPDQNLFDPQHCLLHVLEGDCGRRAGAWGRRTNYIES